jgi:hypothetical protein
MPSAGEKDSNGFDTTVPIIEHGEKVVNAIGRSHI